MEENNHKYEVKTYIVLENDKKLYDVSTTNASTEKRAIANIKFKLFENHRKGNKCSYDGGYMWHEFEFEAEEIRI